MTDLDFPPEDELDRMFERVSNTGRWGPDDELGTLNHIHPESVVRAAGLVRSGRVVSIGLDLDTQHSAKNPQPVRHSINYLAHEHAIGALDEFTVATHGYALTHLDAVGHVYRDGEMYNGRRAADVMTGGGLTFGSIHAQREGIVTRGVLLDVAATRGVDWLATSDAVTVADLEAAETLADVRVGTGDAVFVRVGLGPRESAEGPEDVTERAGLLPECVEWLHQREVAVYSGDCVEKLPSPYARYPIFLHHIGLASMGLVLLDCPHVEPLRAACTLEGRHDFLLVVAPLRLRQGTGSPVNPVCVF